MIYHTFNPSFKRFPTWKAAPSSYALACEQALRGALAAGREKEGELSTTSLKIEYLKDDAKCWLAEMTLVHDVITLGACFHVFSNVCLRSRSSPLRADWWKFGSPVDGEPPGNWRRNSYSRDVVASSSSFSRPAASAPWRACSQATYVQFKGVMSRYLLFFLKS